MLHKPDRRGLRRALTAIPVLAVACAVSGLGSTANAAGLVASTTTVTAPATATAGQSVTITAKVADAVVNGVVVLPSGNVTFSVGSTVLGTKTLSCSTVLQACTASLTTSALPTGLDTITAAYAGDGTSQPSSGQTTVNVLPTAPATQTCTEGQPCDAGTVYATDVSSSIDVQTSGGTTGGGTYTINESTGGTSLSCQDSSGQPGNYLVSASDVATKITYQLIGNAADQFHTAHPTAFYVCYGAPSQFAGSTFNATNNEYEGVLPACNSGATNAPCEQSQSYVLGNGPGGANTETLVVLVSPSTTAGGNGGGNLCTHHTQSDPTNCQTTDPRVGG
jgi:hypothetical protein